MTFFSPAGCCLLAHQSPVIIFADEGGSRRCHFKPAITGATGFLGDTFSGARIYKGNVHCDTLSALFSMEADKVAVASLQDTIQSRHSKVTQIQVPFTHLEPV